MKIINSLLLTALLSGFAQAGDTVIAVKDTSSVEDKIVELHVTFAPPPTVEAKKARKLMARTKTGKAICSGSFVTPLGHILTARHCVQGATEIDVITSDGQEYRADIIAISKNQDLAVIQIGRIPTPFFELAEKNAKGETITMIGSPLGLTGLVTKGIISKLAGDILFLDCTGLPGNSGGPVLNAKGELAGVVSAMVVVILGPAHISVVQSVQSIQYFFYELGSGRYNGQK